MNNSWHNNRDLDVNYLSLMLLPGQKNVHTFCREILKVKP
jgi:hypothetical protein